MTDEQPKTITAYVIKHALRSGVIYRVQAHELGTTGSIQVVPEDRDLAGHFYKRDEWESLEFLAYEKMRHKLVNAIKFAEEDLERLRKLDFSVPAQATEGAAE